MALQLLGNTKFNGTGMKVKTILILLMSLVVLPAVFFILLFSYYAGHRIINEQIDRELGQTTIATMDSVNRFVYDRFNDMQLLISDSLLSNSETSYKEKSDILRVNLLNLGWYDNLYLTDTNGKLVASTDSTVLGADVSQEEWYVRTQKDFIHVSRVVQLPFHPEKDVLVFANTLVDKNKNILGIVFAEFSFDVLKDLLKTNAGQDIDVFLLTKEGDVIASQSTVGKEDPSYLYDNNEYIVSETESEGYLSFDGNGWKLLLGHSQAKAYEPLTRFSNLLIWITLLVILEVLLVGNYVSRLFVRPIDILTKGVQEIEKGNWDHKIHIKQKSEFGYFAENFNNMTASIQEKNQHLLEERGKYKAILDSSEVGIVLFNVQNEVIAYNARFCELFTCPTTQQAHLSALELLNFFDQDSQDPKTQSVLERLRGIRDKADFQENVHCEVTLEKPSLKIISLYTKPVQTKEGGLLGRIWSFHDVTEQRLVEKDKYDFITVASHNLRTPLTVVNWSVDLLESSTSLDETQKEAVENIRSNCERLTTLLNILLDASEVKDGKVAIKLSNFSLSEVIMKAMKNMRPCLARHEKTAVDLSAVQNHLDIKVRADEEKVLQILLAILENACLYAKPDEENKIVVSLAVDAGQKKVTVTVSDTGIGMSAEDQHKVFEKFSRGERASKTHTDGIGLSLYMADTFVRSLGEKLWFESEEGKGTSFHFTLPLA